MHRLPQLDGVPVHVGAGESVARADALQQPQGRRGLFVRQVEHELDAFLEASVITAAG